MEPGQPTVKDGSYPLRRPLYLLSREKPGAVVEAFLAFARSPEAERLLQKAFVPSGPPTSREAKAPDPAAVLQHSTGDKES